MFIQTAFNFSSVVQRLVCRFSGLRLLASRGFLVFLASGPCVASASSYCFGSAAQPRWRCAFSQFVPVAKSKLSVLASGSNISVKPTRLRRSAYLARYAAFFNRFRPPGFVGFGGVSGTNSARVCFPQRGHWKSNRAASSIPWSISNPQQGHFLRSIPSGTFVTFICFSNSRLW